MNQVPFITANPTRLQIINRLAEAHGYTNYLEIGTQSGIVFQQVNCTFKQGIDPDPKWLPEPTDINQRIFTGTSDEFFARNERMFDIVLIDGDHTEAQFLRDALNSLKFLNPGGTIVAHDMLPKEEAHQLVPRVSLAWTGDVWKGWVQLRANPQLRMCVINDDWGVGLIQRGQQQPLSVPLALRTWPMFKKHKAKWLNVVNSVPADYLL